MEIRENNTVCIIAPICDKVDSFKANKIFDILSKETRKIAIDLAYVNDCSIEFIEKIKILKDKNLGIFNISSDIFTIFNIMNIDKFANLFVSELDFEENTRQLINRKFTLI